MRTALVLLLSLACAAVCSAGSNPEAKMCVDFSYPDGVSRIDPPPYTVFDVWIAMEDMECFSGASLKLVLTEDPVAPPSWWMICPGNLPIPIDDADPLVGGTFYCWEDWTDDAFPFIHGMIFYLGGSYDILIAEDEEHPRVVYDCDEPPGWDPYCVSSHGGVGKDPVPGDPGCGSVTPIADAGWTAIKALYRR